MLIDFLDHSSFLYTSMNLTFTFVSFRFKVPLNCRNEIIAIFCLHFAVCSHDSPSAFHLISLIMEEFGSFCLPTIFMFLEMKRIKWKEKKRLCPPIIIEWTHFSLSLSLPSIRFTQSQFDDHHRWWSFSIFISNWSESLKRVAIIIIRSMPWDNWASITSYTIQSLVIIILTIWESFLSQISYFSLSSSRPLHPIISSWNCFLYLSDYHIIRSPSSYGLTSSDRYSLSNYLSIPFHPDWFFSSILSKSWNWWANWIIISLTFTS